MTLDKSNLDNPFAIRTGAIPDRWQKLLSIPEMAPYETFRPVLAVSAALDFRDIFTHLGYNPKKVESAYADAPYPFGMNPLKQDTLKPETWLAAKTEKATKDVASLYDTWFNSMPDPLRTAQFPDHIKALMYQATNPTVNVYREAIDRLTRVLEARYIFDRGDKLPAGLLIYTDEETAAEKLFSGYRLEAGKSAPGDIPQMDQMFYDRLSDFFSTAKEFEIWRGLRRVCDLPDDEIARRAELFRSLTSES